MNGIQESNRRIDDFSPEEVSAILASTRTREGISQFHPVYAQDFLLKLWNPEYWPPAYKLAEPRFLIGMTKEFVKSIEAIDRKLQGRILDAITHILSEPTALHGDTVKPLTGDLAGLWRYRIGDYRLVYQPSIDRGEILLIRFDSRGAVYS